LIKKHPPTRCQLEQDRVADNLTSVAGQICPQFEHRRRFQNNDVCPDQRKKPRQTTPTRTTRKKAPVFGRYQACRSRHKSGSRVSRAPDSTALENKIATEQQIHNISPRHH
jgi:hypothetical protein